MATTNDVSVIPIGITSTSLGSFAIDAADLFDPSGSGGGPSTSGSEFLNRVWDTVLLRFVAWKTVGSEPDYVGVSYPYIFANATDYVFLVVRTF